MANLFHDAIKELLHWETEALKHNRHQISDYNTVTKIIQT